MTISRKILLAFIVFISISPAVVAQDEDEMILNFENANFSRALEELELLFKESPDNKQYKYLMAVCYLNLEFKQEQAIELLEDLKNDPDFPNAKYLLGRAYQYEYKFSDAIDAFRSFLDRGAGTDYNLELAPRQIEYCQNAIEIMKYPVNVEISPISSTVNTSFPDYFPFVPKDESYMIFNSRRNAESVELPNGLFASNVYISVVKDGEFQKPEPCEAINTYDLNEEVVGLSANGQYAVIYKENLNGKGDLFLSEVVDFKPTKPEKLPDEINTRHHEISACISQDGRSIYFASDMPGGYGGVDLYVVRTLPNGKWSEPQNLGPTINTKYDEDFPSLSADGTQLFFSSKGHTSMGGYDIFRAEFDSDKRKYTGVENLRFPINTPGDDLNFMLIETGRYGYMSSVRAEGQGAVDIYRITFKEVEPRFTVVKGYLSSSSGEELNGMFITVYDKETGEIFGDYQPNRSTNRFIMILPPGKYELEIMADDHEIFMEEVTILGKSSFRSEINKEIELVKID